jgi:ADP-heptose:LPS heptosyltransferase
MAEPTVRALVALDQVVVAAPGWGRAVYGHLGVRVVERGQVPSADVAVILPRSFRTAWEARGLPRRVGYPGDLRAPLLTDVVDPVPEHRVHSYARLAGVLGASFPGPPCVRPNPARVEVPEGHVALVPCSPSGETVEWPGFRELALRLGDRAVVYTGPGERFESPARRLAGLPLEQIAAAFRSASVVVVNDSGLSHFARALGVPTLVLHGSTDPARTGALGSRSVSGARPACWPCYAKTCSERPGGPAPCLDQAVDAVLDLL